MKKSWIGWTVVVLALGAGGGWWWTQRGQAEAVQYRTGKIERGSLQATVSASGAVNPVTQVSVGTQVSGQIRDLYVDFNSEVKAGQLIAQIDPETFEYRVRSSQADVDAARAAVLTAQATASASRAQVARVQVDLDEAQRDLERKLSLVEKQFVAQSEADRARALVNTSTAALRAAQAQLAVTEAQIKTASANVAQREAALAQARIDLARTRITSPVDGIVIKRAIEKGQTVAASLQAPELFVIAQNLSDMQVDASVDESDVGRIRTGQRATFTVDAFPGQTFEGTVRQVRKAAQTIANVVTYVAVVGFSNTGSRLMPGMTANVRVITDARESVLKVPNAALRVRIAGVEPPAAPASGAASGTAAPASGTTTGSVGGWSLFPSAMAQPVRGAGSGGGDGGGAAAQRERLITALELTTEQQARLDAIGAEMRPRFQGMADLSDADRAAMRGRLRAEMQQKIRDMLTPAQRQTYERLLAQSLGQGAATPQGAQAAAGAGGVANGLPAARGAPAAARAASSGAQASTPAPSTAAPVAGAGNPSGPVAAPLAGGGAGGGGPLLEFRNRLVAELRLTPDQAAKVDALMADVRPRFLTLRDLAPEERPKARDRIMADLRARIGDVLTAEQKTKYVAMLTEAASRTATRGRIYL
ncbi:MAG: efflux RND transporter periplasmic adaptor subunit, partial [Rhodoferax sp.]|nr:efflux RND transporter periplasmic adaptor subunit [Rhodoferax sp.]